MSLLDEANKSIELVKSDECLCFCSLGKDSLVLLDLIYPKFKRVVCVFMYFVKDLEHVNRWINWVKSKYPMVEFVQVPHWNLTHLLRSGMYCTPNPKIKLLKLADVIEAMRLRTGVYYTFLGMKKADSMNRRLMLKTYTNYENGGNVYPLADWTQKDILGYMKQNKLPMPVRYSNNASGGIGFNIECFLWLEKNFPNDLKKIITAFPMSERILFEHKSKSHEI